MNKRPGTNPRALLATACSLALVAACGGGGGGGEASAPASPNATAPAVTPTSTAGSTCGVPDFAATALARINLLRAAGANCRRGGNFASAAALG